MLTLKSLVRALARQIHRHPERRGVCVKLKHSVICWANQILYNREDHFLLEFKGNRLEFGQE